MDEKMKLKVWHYSSIPKEMLYKRRKMDRGITRELEEHVGSIIRRVKELGDTALVEFTKKFDNVPMNIGNFRVSGKEIEASYDMVEDEQISAIQFLKERVERLEKCVLQRTRFTIEMDDVKVHCSPIPIPSVGCYVPGGVAAYPSTLVMTVVPAKIAGVPRIVICTPPTSDGSINSLSLVAADICGVDEIYKIGGAQAIAALAYGTESMKPVRKIVGPGNKYVTLAKTLISRDVAIDMPAGPSEILVMADETANPKLIALDMISQAEHSIDSISGLISTSEKLVKDVIIEIGNMLSSSRRRGIIQVALYNNAFFIVSNTINEMIEFANVFAPEHLEIIAKNPMEVAKRIKSAGLVLVGSYCPVAASDYCIGTNHVLPTSGFGHVYSGLSVLDFVRRVNVVESSKEGLLKLKGYTHVLAEAENLPNHYLAIEGRFKYE